MQMRWLSQRICGKYMSYKPIRLQTIPVRTGEQLQTVPVRTVLTYEHTTVELKNLSSNAVEPRTHPWGVSIWESSAFQFLGTPMNTSISAADLGKRSNT